MVFPDHTHLIFIYHCRSIHNFFQGDSIAFLKKTDIDYVNNTMFIRRSKPYLSVFGRLLYRTINIIDIIRIEGSPILKASTSSEIDHDTHSFILLYN